MNRQTPAMKRAVRNGYRRYAPGDPPIILLILRDEWKRAMMRAVPMPGDYVAVKFEISALRFLDVEEEMQ